MASLREKSPVLHLLRISLHVMFAFLLAVGCLSALQDGLSLSFLGPSVGALGLVYMAGTVMENRFTRGHFGGRRGANIVRARPVLARAWLGLVGLFWVFLLFQHPGFTWLMFPLVFLCMHILPRLAALWAVLLLTVFAIFWPISHSQVLSPGAVVGPSLGALLAVIFSLAYRRLYQDSLTHQRTLEKLRAAQAELVQQEHEAGRLEERERLAREIHDTLAQGLSSIVLISRAATASSGGDKVGRQLEVINRVASDNLAEARRFIRNLSSPQLSASLVPALERLCAETQAQAAARGDSLVCSFRLDGPGTAIGGGAGALGLENMSEKVQETLVRIAQGALANVAAHAEASQAQVTLGLWEEAVTLDIFDNGRGFVPQAADSSPATSLFPERSGFGLISLTARAQEIGASLTVESAPGEGTALALTLPLEQAFPGE